jgi:predicted TPR repeat methyltransferase
MNNARNNALYIEQNFSKYAENTFQTSLLVCSKLDYKVPIL